MSRASENSGEKLWRLPLEETYWESMKSGVADMVNTGGRQGGSITAALFLKQVMFSLSALNAKLAKHIVSKIDCVIYSRQT